MFVLISNISFSQATYSNCYLPSNFICTLNNPYCDTTAVQAPSYTDYAQPYYSDTTLTVVGIYTTFYHNYKTENKRFFQIRDSLMNILVSYCYDTVPCTASVSNFDFTMKSLYFQNPIHVKDTFYVSVNVDSSELYDTYVPINGCATGMCQGIMPLIYSQNQWYKFNTLVPFEPAFMYMFPILQSNSSLKDDAKVDKFSSLYPNPAKEEININSSFRINNIEIYNSNGQEVLKQNINDFMTKINISTFRAGTYIAKIYTDSGVSTKKFIVE